jgi:hypothetical protein
MGFWGRDIGPANRFQINGFVPVGHQEHSAGHHLIIHIMLQLGRERGWGGG